MDRKKHIDVNEAAKDAQELTEEDLNDSIEVAVRNYHAPKSPEVLRHLEWFRDQKFGLMVHWGLYNQLGIKESWPLVDNEWSKWQFRPGTPNAAVKEMYSRLHKGFLPLRFDPDEWADIAWRAGFRYLVFTAKHHDGFCMWDTKTTDYKVTGPEVPWRTEKNADITKALFDSFRAKGMGISLYYSRADFKCPLYWEEGYAEKDGTVRLPSYDPDEKPEKWKAFQEYVYSQLHELVSGYGKIDCLWYDGGCDGVKLGLPEMTERLRKIQPWMIGVIRGGQGVCEDIVTPEIKIPDRPIPVPWEACTVMGKKFPGEKYTSFGYTYDQDYMSAKEIAHLLLDIVAKGGNLALNLAPQPDGRLPGRAVRELRILAEWMDIFGPAIYATRVCAPYRKDHWAFTARKDGKKVHAFYLYDDQETIPDKLTIPYPSDTERAVWLRTGEELSFRKTQEGVEVFLPSHLTSRTGDIADCIVLDC